MVKLNVSGATFGKAVVPIYRLVSMFSLYGILAGILWFGILFVFFFGSSSWVAPFAVNPSDVQVLAITAQVTNSQAAIDTLQLDAKSSTENLNFSKSQLKGLLALDKDLHSKVSQQTKEWVGAASNLSAYDVEAKDNIAMVQKDVAHNEEMKALIQNDLKAGLITKEDALSSFSYIDMLAINMTAAKVAENDIQDSIRQHKMSDLTSLTIEGQHVSLEFQISQLLTAIRTDEQHLLSDAQTIATIKRAADVAKQSPFYRAVTGENVKLGIVPYDPKNALKVGSPVYSCWLGISLCTQVGKVAAVYQNEQVFENPLTKVNTRGYVVQLDVTDEAMRSKSLIVSHKPLLF